MIINLIGQPHSGKTTLSNTLANIIKLTRPHLTVFQIDGDKIRELFVNHDYSEAGRRKNIELAYNIARYLNDLHTFNVVIISLVSPYADLREKLKQDTNAWEFFITTTQIRGRENYHVENYEIPTSDFVTVSTDCDEITSIHEILSTINL